MRRARAALVALLLAACASPGAAPGSAPGAARPASAGYEAMTPSGVELVYDPVRRSYAVPAAPGVFWLDGHYFERGERGWLTSEALDGPWLPCADSELPAGLRGR
ncbi:MAG TPA: hypothetical protein VMR31_18620 [Myxococcota bacterium]|nr:hypothetical protein [Myxococcota bacterium]